MNKFLFISVFIIIQTLLVNTIVLAEEKIPEWKCNQITGLTTPAPVCSKNMPCKKLLPTYRFIKPPVFKIDSPSQGKPLCGTGSRGKRVGRPFYNDGDAKIVKTDLDNMTRYYCQYTPPSATKGNKLPLVIFVHGSGGYGGSMYDTTSLRGKAKTYNFTNDSAGKGFILVSLQSRNLHWPTKDPEDGAKFDSYHRDFSTNPDVEYLDKVIDKIISEGLADPERIYLMGWSNGARFTAFYGLTRHHQATSEGNKIAAIANFSGGDPYKNIQENFKPGCQVKNYPQSNVPLYMISRTCDGVTCNEAQADKFRKGRKSVTPGNVAGTWIKTLKNKINNPNVKWQRINYYSKAANYCTPAFLCSSLMALRNHLFWPDGHEDKSGIDWEPEMLNFLKNHPLSN